MRILCVSGSRADYGGIEATHQALVKHNIDSKLIRVGDIFDTTDIDMVVLLGDRSEVLKYAVDFYLEKKVIVHLSGGDITEGSQDDCMRHAITKLSHLHFPTNADSAKRIIQMGEEAWRVKVVGYPGADDLTCHDKEIATKLAGAEDFILVVWHPNTLASIDQVIAEAQILTNSLEQINFRKVVIGPNMDFGGYELANFLEKWTGFTGNRYFNLLPRDMYLTLLKHCKCLVGNSSSAYYEASKLGTPCVDVGDRQRGRDKPLNVVICPVKMESILESISACFWAHEHGGEQDNMYYNPDGAAHKIAATLAKIHEPKKLLRKRFYQIPH